MSNWSSYQFTRRGEQLRAKVEAGKCKLTLTKIKIGNGSVTLGDIKDMNDLKSPQLVLGISSCAVSAEDDRVCEVVGIASSFNVENAFSVTEMGLYANDPDVGEILYLVEIDTSPDDMPNKNAQSPVTLTYQIELVTSNTANVTALVSPAGLVNVEMLADGAGLVRRNTRYEMGDILYDTQLTRHDLRLECVQAGTTAATLQDLSSVHLGQSITDGTVVWRVKRLYTIEGDMFEIDTDGGIMPTAEPHYSVNYELDEDGNIMPKEM